MEQLIKAYQEGKSYKDLSIEFGISKVGIWRILKANGAVTRGSGVIKHLPNPFIAFNRESYYWLGYIIADGSIVHTKKYRNYTLHLYSKNIEVLNRYNEFMTNRCKIYLHTKSSNTYSARTSDKSLCEWLITVCNITPNKALTINPTLPITWDLLRGYFDGDGSIRLTKSKYEVKFTTGSKVWAERIKEFLAINNIYSVINVKGNAFDINIYRKTEVQKLFNYLYNDTTLYLQYKFHRFDALFGNK